MRQDLNFGHSPQAPHSPERATQPRKGYSQAKKDPQPPQELQSMDDQRPPPPRPQKQPQIAIQTISKTETSKAPLKPISRKTQEGKACTCWAPDFGHSPQDTSQSRKGYPQALQDCKSGHKCQSQTMSKIKTTSKVSLKLTSKINPRRRGAHESSPRFWIQPASSPQPRKGHPAQKGLFPGEKGPKAPTGTTEHG